MVLLQEGISGDRHKRIPMPPAGVPPDADPRGMILAIVILLLVILGTGILFYQSQEGQIKAGVTSDLTAIQTLKGDQIAAWRQDRLYDARGLSSSAFFIEGVNHYLTYGDDESKNTILRRFREMNTSPHYDNVLLVDFNGTVRLSLDPSVTSLQPPVTDLVNTSLRSGTVALTDFYRIPGSSRASMDVIAPLSMTRAGVSEPVGAVLLSINPEGFLYPLVQSWPVPSRSAETLLVEREGDHVLYLNELRHQNNTALNLTIPLTRTDVPAVKAVLGTTGAFVGKDYRGVDVISVLGPVPGSPWFMVAKVDTAEAYSSWQRFSALIIVLVAITLAGALIIVGLLWQRRQKYYYQSLYALESERTREELRNRERLEILLHLAEMDSVDEQKLAEFVLDAGCRLTESPLAFIGKLSPDETVFETAAWSKPVKEDSPLARMTRFLPCEKAGIWAEAVRKRTPVIVNGHIAPPEGESRSPPGYDPATRFVSVPIFEAQRLVLVFTVASRETGYTSIDVDNLTLLAQGVWNHLRKRSADELLRQKTTDLEAAFEEITATDEELRTNYEDLAGLQDALTESERKYRNLYHYAQVGLFETSFKDGTVVACNQQYADLAGFSSVEDAIGKDVLGLYVNPEDRTEVGRILREQGSIENHIVQFRNKRTGRIFWAQFSARFNYERDVAEGTIIDITVQKEAETEIRNAKNFLDRIIEQSPNPIWISDEKGTLIRLNKACCDVLHINPEEVIGKYNVFEDSILEAQGRMSLVRSVFEEGKSVNFDLEYDTKLLSSLHLYQSAKVYLNVTIFLVRDTTGRITNAVIQHLDFTERRKAEAALKKSEDAFRSLAENASDGFLVGAANGMHVFANKRAAEITGYSIDELVHTSIRQISHPDEFERVIQDRFRKHMAGEPAPNHYETILLGKDGRQIPIELSSLKIAWYGQPADLIVFRDITERKAAEEEIKSTNAFLDMVIDMSPFSMWISDKTGTVTRVNRSLCQALNLTPDKIVGKYNVLRDTNLEIQGVMPDVRAVFDTSTPAHFSIPWKASDAGAVDLKGARDTYIEVSLFPIRNVRGELTNVVCQWVDITERKKAEDSLRETNEYLQNLFNYAYAPIIVWDPQFRITRFNHAFESLTGRTEQEVVGQHLDILFPETSREVSLEHIRRTVSGERWESVEIPILHVSGRTRTVLWNSSNIVDSRGTFISTIALGYDITDRKAVADALRQSEEKYRVLFTRMTEGSALHEMVNDTSGNPVDYRILDVNPAFESVLGTRREDVVGKTSREAYSIDPPPYLDTYARVAATGQPEMFEQYFEPLKKHFSISVFSPEKGQFATIFEDITERKQAEEFRERLIKELEQKNTELEQFTYTVSHDLKSPLITIRGFAGVLDEDIQKKDGANIARDLERINEAAQKMDTLLKDLLNLSRIGRIVNPSKEMPLTEIAHEAVDLLHIPLQEREVKVTIEPDMPAVTVDRVRIREVLINLVENAIKFMGDQPHPEIDIGVQYDKGRPVFFVQDNGIGIDPRYHKRIFNLFEKLDPRKEGSGAGLAIVKRIIEAHGGKIWVESAGPGTGSIFRFTLPDPLPGKTDIHNKEEKGE